MRFLGPQRAYAQFLERPGGPPGGAAEEILSACRELARLARLHWILAITEISKGLAIVAIGDMVIAEDFGEAVRIAALGLPEMRGATRARAIGWARVGRGAENVSPEDGRPAPAPESRTLVLNQGPSAFLRIPFRRKVAISPRPRLPAPDDRVNVDRLT